MQNLDPTTLLLQLGILLAVAFLLGRLAERIGLPATTGELAAGLVLGPSVLGSIAAANGSNWLFTPTSGQLESLRGIALFCGVLLIGVAGATVDLPFVRARVRTVWLISLGALGLPLVFDPGPGPLRRSPAPRAQRNRMVFRGVRGSRTFGECGARHRQDLRRSGHPAPQPEPVVLSVAVIDDATVWVGLSIIAALIHARQSSDSQHCPGICCSR